MSKENIEIPVTNQECDQNGSPSICKVGKLCVPLNVIDLREESDKFQQLCQNYACHYNKRCRKRYYHLGKIVLLENDTTSCEMKRLLKHGVRTFLIDLFIHKHEELKNFLELLHAAICDVQNKYFLYNRLVIGLAVQISGDCCRLGCFHNNCSICVHCNDVMTLTTNTDYRYSSFKEICYVHHLIHYLQTLKLSDEIALGSAGVRGKVVKLLPKSCAICIVNGGFLHSYDYIQLPDRYTLTENICMELLEDDLSIAKYLGAHYIVLPHIRSQHFVASVKRHMKLNDTLAWKLVGSIDFDYVRKYRCDVLSVLKLLDYLLLPQLFLGSTDIQKYIIHDIIPIVRCLKLPIIGQVPIEHCCDFKLYENHQYLWYCDALFIQKSKSARKYPLIASKLLSIVNFKVPMVDNVLAVKNLENFSSIVNFIIRMVRSIECQAILLYSKCKESGISLARMEIYCPVYVIMPIDDHPESNEECILQLARWYHLRRNLHPIIYTNNMNNCNFLPLEYALDLLRSIGQLETGDFVITLEAKKQIEEIGLGLNNNFVTLRAFYLPPKLPVNKYRYS